MYMTKSSVVIPFGALVTEITRSEFNKLIRGFHAVRYDALFYGNDGAPFYAMNDDADRMNAWLQAVPTRSACIVCGSINDNDVAFIVIPD